MGGRGYTGGVLIEQREHEEGGGVFRRGMLKHTAFAHDPLRGA